ncbi:hypothetical protein E8E11_002476 [Didymella keratinophila]|nr:hypothetical protein E8E11_002476 [Didymella keratinophila]
MLQARKDILLIQGGVVRGSMINKFRPPDVELGKKDDDHKFKPARRSGFPLRWRRKRILAMILGLIAFSVFMHYTGSSSGEKKSVHANPFAYTPPSRDPAHDSGSRWTEIQEPTGAPPGLRSPSKGEPTPHTFPGPFKFYRLARSLRGAAHTDGYRKINRNVLFAAASLQSAATLIPLACEMGRWNRNWVHVAFLGREDIPLDDILAINGVDREACKVLWHDARPDYSEWSTEERAQASVQSALTHIQSFLHPQVAVVDDEGSEDAFFTAGVRNRTDAFGMPRIEVPVGSSEEYTWMTRLDAGSLSAWHTPTVDILVQVPADSSSVLHLLKSLKEADYAGLGYPRITLDLPPSLDPTVQRVLESFVWPHTHHRNAENQLVLRRRIPNHRASQEAAAIAFAESFFPANRDAHVLVLDPAAVVAPSYFHYIKYALLEYRYSSFGRDDSSSVMGISLELPSMLVDGETPLTPPGKRDMHAAQYTALADLSDKTARGAGVPFAMQAPNAHASLFFGHVWSEWHSFLGERVSMHQQRLGKGKGASRVKLLSETMPSWAEYMLEFMRARGYFLLFPGTTGKEALVSVHGEMVRAPEEFTSSTSKASGDEEDETPKLDLDAPFLRAASGGQQGKLKPPEPPLVRHSQPIHRTLPFDGDLPEVEHLPKLLYNGHKMDPSSIAVVAAKYRRQFMEEVGGCKVPKGKKRKQVQGSARDLFCFGDEGEEEWEDDWLLAGGGKAEDGKTPAAEKAASAGAKTSNLAGKAPAASGTESTPVATPSPTPAAKHAGGVHDI